MTSKAGGQRSVVDDEAIGAGPLGTQLVKWCRRWLTASEAAFGQAVQRLDGSVVALQVQHCSGRINHWQWMERSGAKAGATSSRQAGSAPEPYNQQDGLNNLP